MTKFSCFMADFWNFLNKSSFATSRRLVFPELSVRTGGRKKLWMWFVLPQSTLALLKNSFKRVHAVSRLNVEFRFLRRGENRKNSRRNTSRSKGKNNHIWRRRQDLKARPHYWKASASTITPPLLPRSCYHWCVIDILCWCLLKVNLQFGRFHLQ